MSAGPPAPAGSISRLWFPFLYGLARSPCLGTALLLVFPIGRMRRIWRHRGLAEAERSARWARLVFHKRVALALSLVIGAASFVVPVLLGLVLQVAGLP